MHFPLYIVRLTSLVLCKVMLRKTVTVMKRQKKEPGSLCVHFVSISASINIYTGFRKLKNALSDKQSCFNFQRTSIVNFDAVFFSENVLPALIKCIKFDCTFFILVIFHLTQYLKPSLTHSRF